MLVQLVAFAATLFAALNSTGVFKYEDHPAFMWCAVLLTGIVALITFWISLMTFFRAPGSRIRHVLYSMTLMLAGDEADRVLAFYRRIGLSYGHYFNPITNRLECESVGEFMCAALDRSGNLWAEKSQWPLKDVLSDGLSIFDIHYENFTWIHAQFDPDRKEAEFRVMQRGTKQCDLIISALATSSECLNGCTLIRSKVFGRLIIGYCYVSGLSKDTKVKSTS